jgi:hypothetical protein
MATKFLFNVVQDIQAFRRVLDTNAVVTLYIESRNDVDPTGQDFDWYVAVVRFESAVKELREEAAEFCGRTPMAVIDQALSFAALALRGKCELGWSFQPDDSAVRDLATEISKDQGVALPASTNTFAGSVIFSALLDATGVSI